MQNASVLSRRNSTTPSSQAPAPHIFRPEGNDRAAELAKLFNLRRRPGYYNAEAKVALLRRAKEPPHDELLVDFSGASVNVQLVAGGLPLVRGDWGWQATAAGEPLVSEGSWSGVCWLTGKTHDYLEIEQTLSGGWKLRRQMLLGREGRFLLLADALVGSRAEPVELRYSHALPLAAATVFRAARETREGWLQNEERRRATVMPSALPEWRSEFSHAELVGEDGCLTLQQAALGRSLYAPLWIDLDPRRASRPLTWRRLTIGENFAVVPRDVAAAFRIQIGREQWLIYRSLAKRGNRSLLGYNTLHAFDCLKILPDGATKEIVAVE